MDSPQTPQNTVDRCGLAGKGCLVIVVGLPRNLQPKTTLQGRGLDSLLRERTPPVDGSAMSASSFSSQCQHLHSRHDGLAFRRSVCVPSPRPRSVPAPFLPMHFPSKARHAVELRETGLTGMVRQTKLKHQGQHS